MPNNSSKLRPLAVVAVLVIIGAAVGIMLQPAAKKTSIGEHAEDAPVMQHYSNPSFGIAFSYGDSYVLSEHESGNQGEREHHTIVLMEKTDASDMPVNGEGPPTITIDIFGNGIDKLPAETWIQNTSASNFKLSPDGVLATTSAAGMNAYTYTWDGLYRGRSVVFAHGTNVFMLSVTSIDTSDRIREDFSTLLSSLSVI